MPFFSSRRSRKLPQFPRLASPPSGGEELEGRKSALLCRLRSGREEAILRPRKAEVFAQRLALVLGAEDAAPLQLGHDLVHEIVEAARQVGEHDVEAVA